MKCPACERDVSAVFTSCPYCGAPTGQKVASGSGSADDMLARIRGQADNLRREATGAVSRDDRGVLSDRGLTVRQGARHFGPARRDWSLIGNSAAVMAYGDDADSDANSDEWGDQSGHSIQSDHPFLQGLVTDLVIAEAEVRGCGVISDNPRYFERIDRTIVIAMWDSFDVNAGAGDIKEEFKEQVDELKDVDSIVTMNAGQIFSARLIGVMYAAMQEKEADGPLVNGFFRLSKLLTRNGMNLSPADAEAILDEIPIESSDENVALASIITQAVISSTIAHEFGHIALGHTAGGCNPYNVTRNQEREADSFASSVLATGPNPGVAATGQVFDWLMMVWCEDVIPAIKSDSRRSHPYSIERLRAVFKSNGEALKDAGISWELVRSLMPNSVQILMVSGSNVLDTVSGPAKIQK